MSTQTARPLSLLHIDFDNLYARHLGRHSQFGINVGHLAALFGLWFGAYAALYQLILLLGLPAGCLVIGALALSYLVMVAVNAPYTRCWRRPVSWRFSSRASSRCRVCQAGRSWHLSPLFRSSTRSRVEPQDLDRRRGHDGI